MKRLYCLSEQTTSKENSQHQRCRLTDDAVTRDRFQHRTEQSAHQQFSLQATRNLWTGVQRSTIYGCRRREDIDKEEKLFNRRGDFDDENLYLRRYQLQDDNYEINSGLSSPNNKVSCIETPKLSLKPQILKFNNRYALCNPPSPVLNQDMNTPHSTNPPPLSHHRNLPQVPPSFSRSDRYAKPAVPKNRHPATITYPHHMQYLNNHKKELKHSTFSTSLKIASVQNTEGVKIISAEKTAVNNSTLVAVANPPLHIETHSLPSPSHSEVTMGNQSQKCRPPSNQAINNHNPSLQVQTGQQRTLRPTTTGSQDNAYAIQDEEFNPQPHNGSPKIQDPGIQGMQLIGKVTESNIQVAKANPCRQSSIPQEKEAKNQIEKINSQIQPSKEISPQVQITAPLQQVVDLNASIQKCSPQVQISTSRVQKTQTKSPNKINCPQIPQTEEIKSKVFDSNSENVKYASQFKKVDKQKFCGSTPDINKDIANTLPSKNIRYPAKLPLKNVDAGNLATPFTNPKYQQTKSQLDEVKSDKKRKSLKELETVAAKKRIHNDTIYSSATTQQSPQTREEGNTTEQIGSTRETNVNDTRNNIAEVIPTSNTKTLQDLQISVCKTYSQHNSCTSGQTVKIVKNSFLSATRNQASLKQTIVPQKNISLNGISSGELSTVEGSKKISHEHSIPQPKTCLEENKNTSRNLRKRPPPVDSSPKSKKPKEKKIMEVCSSKAKRQSLNINIQNQTNSLQAPSLNNILTEGVESSIKTNQAMPSSQNLAINAVDSSAQRISSTASEKISGGVQHFANNKSLCKSQDIVAASKDEEIVYPTIAPRKRIAHVAKCDSPLNKVLLNSTSAKNTPGSSKSQPNIQSSLPSQKSESKGSDKSGKQQQSNPGRKVSQQVRRESTPKNEDVANDRKASVKNTDIKNTDKKQSLRLSKIQKNKTNIPQDNSKKKVINSAIAKDIASKSSNLNVTHGKKSKNDSNDSIQSDNVKSDVLLKSKNSKEIVKTVHAAGKNIVPQKQTTKNTNKNISDSPNHKNENSTSSEKQTRKPSEINKLHGTSSNNQICNLKNNVSPKNSDIENNKSKPNTSKDIVARKLSKDDQKIGSKLDDKETNQDTNKSDFTNDSKIENRNASQKTTQCSKKYNQEIKKDSKTSNIEVEKQSNGRKKQTKNYAQGGAKPSLGSSSAQKNDKIQDPKKTENANSKQRKASDSMCRSESQDCQRPGKRQSKDDIQSKTKTTLSPSGQDDGKQPDLTSKQEGKEKNQQVKRKSSSAEASHSKSSELDVMVSSSSSKEKPGPLSSKQHSKDKTENKRNSSNELKKTPKKVGEDCLSHKNPSIDARRISSEDKSKQYETRSRKLNHKNSRPGSSKSCNSEHKEIQSSGSEADSSLSIVNVVQLDKDSHEREKAKCSSSSSFVIENNEQIIQAEKEKSCEDGQTPSCSLINTCSDEETIKSKHTEDNQDQVEGERDISHLKSLEKDHSDDMLCSEGSANDRMSPNTTAIKNGVFTLPDMQKLDEPIVKSQDVIETTNEVPVICSISLPSSCTQEKEDLENLKTQQEKTASTKSDDLSSKFMPKTNSNTMPISNIGEESLEWVNIDLSNIDSILQDLVTEELAVDVPCSLQLSSSNVNLNFADNPELSNSLQINMPMVEITATSDNITTNEGRSEVNEESNDTGIKLCEADSNTTSIDSDIIKIVENQIVSRPSSSLSNATTVECEENYKEILDEVKDEPNTMEKNEASSTEDDARGKPQPDSNAKTNDKAESINKSPEVIVIDDDSDGGTDDESFIFSEYDTSSEPSIIDLSDSDDDTNNNNNLLNCVEEIETLKKMEHVTDEEIKKVLKEKESRAGIECLEVLDCNTTYHFKGECSSSTNANIVKTVDSSTTNSYKIENLNEESSSVNIVDSSTSPSVVIESTCGGEETSHSSYKTDESSDILDCNAQITVDNNIILPVESVPINTEQISTIAVEPEYNAENNSELTASNTVENELAILNNTEQISTLAIEPHNNVENSSESIADLPTASNTEANEPAMFNNTEQISTLAIEPDNNAENNSELTEDLPTASNTVENEPAMLNNTEQISTIAVEPEYNAENNSELTASNTVENELAILNNTEQISTLAIEPHNNAESKSELTEDLLTASNTVENEPAMLNNTEQIGTLAIESENNAENNSESTVNLITALNTVENEPAMLNNAEQISTSDVEPENIAENNSESTVNLITALNTVENEPAMLNNTEQISTSDVEPENIAENNSESTVNLINALNTVENELAILNNSEQISTSDVESENIVHAENSSESTVNVELLIPSNTIVRESNKSDEKVDASNTSIQDDQEHEKESLQATISCEDNASMQTTIKRSPLQQLAANSQIVVTPLKTSNSQTATPVIQSEDFAQPTEVNKSKNNESLNDDVGSTSHSEPYLVFTQDQEQVEKTYRCLKNIPGKHLYHSVVRIVEIINFNHKHNEERRRYEITVLQVAIENLMRNLLNEFQNLGIQQSKDYILQSNRPDEVLVLLKQSREAEVLKIRELQRNATSVREFTSQLLTGQNFNLDQQVDSSQVQIPINNNNGSTNCSLSSSSSTSSTTLDVLSLQIQNLLDVKEAIKNIFANSLLWEAFPATSQQTSMSQPPIQQIPKAVATEPIHLMPSTQSTSLSRQQKERDLNVAQVHFNAEFISLDDIAAAYFEPQDLSSVQDTVVPTNAPSQHFLDQVYQMPTQQNITPAQLEAARNPIPAARPVVQRRSRKNNSQEVPGFLPETAGPLSELQSLTSSMPLERGQSVTKPKRGRKKNVEPRMPQQQTCPPPSFINPAPFAPHLNSNLMHPFLPHPHLLEQQMQYLQNGKYAFWQQRQNQIPNQDAYQEYLFQLQHRTPVASHAHLHQQRAHPVSSHTYLHQQNVPPVSSRTHLHQQNAPPVSSHTHLLQQHAPPVASHTHLLQQHAPPVASHSHLLQQNAPPVSSQTHLHQQNVPPVASHTHLLQQHVPPVSSQTHLHQQNVPPVASHTHLLQQHVPPVSSQNHLHQQNVPPVSSQTHLHQQNAPPVSSQTHLHQQNVPPVASHTHLLQQHVPPVSSQTHLLQQNVPPVASHTHLHQQNVPPVSSHTHLLQQHQQISISNIHQDQLLRHHIYQQQFVSNVVTSQHQQLPRHFSGTQQTHHRETGSDRSISPLCPINLSKMAPSINEVQETRPQQQYLTPPVSVQNVLNTQHLPPPQNLTSQNKQNGTQAAIAPMANMRHSQHLPPNSSSRLQNLQHERHAPYLPVRAAHQTPHVPTGHNTVVLQTTGFPEPLKASDYEQAAAAVHCGEVSIQLVENPSNYYNLGGRSTAINRNVRQELPNLQHGRSINQPRVEQMAHRADERRQPQVIPPNTSSIPHLLPFSSQSSEHQNRAVGPHFDPARNQRGINTQAYNPELFAYRNLPLNTLASQGFASAAREYPWARSQASALGARPDQFTAHEKDKAETVQPPLSFVRPNESVTRADVPRLGRPGEMQLSPNNTQQTSKPQMPQQSTEIVAADSTGDLERPEFQPCSVCSKLADKICACGTFYCSLACQIQVWDKEHIFVCSGVDKNELYDLIK